MIHRDARRPMVSRTPRHSMELSRRQVASNLGHSKQSRDATVDVGLDQRLQQSNSDCFRLAEAMDAGADVSWKERFNHDELSAIQHAMNLKLQDEAAFFAEYQNESLPVEAVGADQLTTDQVAAKINHMPRGRVPIAGNHLTAFIDVQGKLLFYVVAAWEEDFTGYIVDYGSYPDQ